MEEYIQYKPGDWVQRFDPLGSRYYWSFSHNTDDKCIDLPSDGVYGSVYQDLMSVSHLILINQISGVHIGVSYTVDGFLYMVLPIRDSHYS